MRPDGGFVSKFSTATNNVELAGSWKVQGGILTSILTNAQGTDARFHFSSVTRYKIVHISRDEMTFQIGTETNLTIMRRR
jgi:hypothetical protein